MKTTILALSTLIGGMMCWAALCPAAEEDTPLTYRHFNVEEADGRVISMTPIPETSLPLWAREVSQATFEWPTKPDADKPFFAQPIPFVIPPSDEGEPFRRHNHQPAITWLPNGDLLAIWYSTESESGTELTVLASRLRCGKDAWDPSSDFFKAPNRNMHGSSILHDGQGAIYHFNGMAPDGGRGWAKLALLMRVSRDNGVTWTPPRAIDPRLVGRHQVIADTLMTKSGVLMQNCDAVPGGNGGTALHISQDGGATWNDPGQDKPHRPFRKARGGRDHRRHPRESSGTERRSADGTGPGRLDRRPDADEHLRQPRHDVDVPSQSISTHRWRPATGVKTP